MKLLIKPVKKQATLYIFLLSNEAFTYIFQWNIKQSELDAFKSVGLKE